MNALDMAYHLATNWAVHLNYVTIKLTVVFFSVWMISEFIGIGKKEGIVASILGPLVFYFYYLFANPTLNREIFRIDEQFWFFFLHAGFMLIAYFSAYSIIRKKGGLEKIGVFAITVLMSIALDALFIMSRWRIQGIDEKTATKMFTFGLIVAPVVAYIAGVFIQMVMESIRKSYWDSPNAPLIAALIVWLMTKDIVHSIFSFVFVSLSYLIIRSFKKGLAAKS